MKKSKQAVKQEVKQAILVRDASNAGFSSGKLLVTRELERAEDKFPSRLQMQAFRTGMMFALMEFVLDADVGDDTTISRRYVVALDETAVKRILHGDKHVHGIPAVYARHARGPNDNDEQVMDCLAHVVGTLTHLPSGERACRQDCRELWCEKNARKESK